jgi:hypothetical protein
LNRRVQRHSAVAEADGRFDMKAFIAASDALALDRFTDVTATVIIARDHFGSVSLDLESYF